jgi:hypothetical protein
MPGRAEEPLVRGADQQAITPGLPGLSRLRSLVRASRPVQPAP